MELLVEEIMRRNVATIAPDVTLPKLEDAFLKERASGFPVLDKGELVGIVSRSDVVRQMSQEHHLAETTSDFYIDSEGFHEHPLVSFKEIADRVGERMERLTVRDVMSEAVYNVRPEQTVRQVAQTMFDNHIHRVIVASHNQLVGIVSTLDIVALVANGRLRPVA